MVVSRKRSLGIKNSARTVGVCPVQSCEQHGHHVDKRRFKMGIAKKSNTRTFDGANDVVIKTERTEYENGTFKEERRVEENSFLPGRTLSRTVTTGKIDKK
jgi:hypothetical protein